MFLRVTLCCKNGDLISGGSFGRIMRSIAESAQAMSFSSSLLKTQTRNKHVSKAKGLIKHVNIVHVAISIFVCLS